MEVEIWMLPSLKVTYPQKIGGPWNFGDSDWKASFSGVMLVLGTWNLFFFGDFFEKHCRDFSGS